MRCYKCGRELPKSSKTCPACKQQVFTTYVKGEMSQGRRLDGCLPEEPRASDYRATPNLTSLPFRVDLREDCSAVEDQGQIGSCVANAIVGAFEHQQRRDGKPAVDLSRLFVYYNARRIGGTQMWVSGSTISTGMAALLAFGAPNEASWPYRPEQFASAPTPEVYQQASTNVPAEYARVEGLEHVKGALARRYPVVFAASIPERCYAEAERTGVAPTPTRAEVDAIRTQHGRHALLLVGYNQDEGMMLVRNSWGQSWGDRGYFKISIDAFGEVLAPRTTWILGRLDNNDFDVVRPGKTSTPAAPKVEGGVKDMTDKLRNDIRDSLKKDMGDALKDIKERVKPPRRDN
jgi:hypothetical protein